jgi:hypothetical protein
LQVTTLPDSVAAGFEASFVCGEVTNRVVPEKQALEAKGAASYSFPKAGRSLPILWRDWQLEDAEAVPYGGKAFVEEMAVQEVSTEASYMGSLFSEVKGQPVTVSPLTKVGLSLLARLHFEEPYES